MNAKSSIAFVLGLVIGAATLFGFEHAHKLTDLFRSPAEVMQASMPGIWHGQVAVAGNNVDFSLNVKSDGKTLSGVISSSQVGSIPCDHLAIDSAGNISFSAHVDDKDADFTGKLAPDDKSMTGNMTSSVGSGAWSLVRKKS